MKKRRKVRMVDVFSQIVLPVLAVVQAYVIFKKLTDTRLDITIFMWWIVLIIMTIVMLSMTVRIYRSKYMNMESYFKDEAEDEQDWRRRKRKTLIVMFIIQGIIMTLLVINAVFKT